MVNPGLAIQPYIPDNLTPGIKMMNSTYKRKGTQVQVHELGAYLDPIQANLNGLYSSTLAGLKLTFRPISKPTLNGQIVDLFNLEPSYGQTVVGQQFELVVTGLQSDSDPVKAYVHYKVPNWMPSKSGYLTQLTPEQLFTSFYGELGVPDFGLIDSKLLAQVNTVQLDTSLLAGLI